MQEIPGKLDCTRIKPHPRSGAAHILLLVTLICVFCSGGFALSPGAQTQYPEIAWLGRNTYCNPYLGFRLNLPSEIISEPLFFPVQPHGRHMLLALHLERLDRSADLFISAAEEGSEDLARLAAKARVQQARASGFFTNGPHTVSVHAHQFYRLQVIAETEGPGNESSYFLFLHGYLLHVAIFSHADNLAASLGSALEHMEFVDPGESACTFVAPDAIAGLTQPASEPPRLYYGPALPTGLVDSTLRNPPGSSVPAGQFFHDTFTDAALGVRIVLPPGWQAQPNDEAYRVIELMRDPTDDPGTSDRRRALFRACSRVLFAAADPTTEMTAEVHPALAVVAMPQGCVPDMVPPAPPVDRAAAREFATATVHSLGVPLLGRASLHGITQAHLTLNLDGTLPYRLSGEKLSRRLSLRVSATASGPWLILVYSVVPTPAAQRDLESHITLGTPDTISAK